MGKGSRVRRQRDIEDQKTLHAIQAVMMISVATLRNQGWGETRLRRFSEQFGKTLKEVSDGTTSLSELADTVYDETGLRVVDLKLK